MNLTSVSLSPPRGERRSRPPAAVLVSSGRTPLHAAAMVRGPLRWARRRFFVVSMILSENRFPLFGIMLQGNVCNTAALATSLKLAERPPHPRSLRSLDLSPRGGERRSAKIWVLRAGNLLFSPSQNVDGRTE